MREAMRDQYDRQAIRVLLATLAQGINELDEASPESSAQNELRQFLEAVAPGFVDPDKPDEVQLQFQELYKLFLDFLDSIPSSPPH